MPSGLRLLMAVSLLLCVQPQKANANFVPPLSLPQLVSASDVVVVGQPRKLGTIDAGQRGVLRIAFVDVYALLQGDVGPQITVVTVGNSSEEDAGPLQLGHKYLLFLKKDRLGLFEAVNGPRSAVDLGKAE
jgi:hypothetical protein